MRSGDGGGEKEEGKGRVIIGSLDENEKVVKKKGVKRRREKKREGERGQSKMGKGRE